MSRTVNRREFLAKAGAAALSATVLPAGLARGIQSNEKIGLGLVGCGGRGVWIAKLFLKHGGYEISAVADYFEDRAAAAGDALGVPASRRFSGLAGYKRLLEAGVDAVAIETPPYFHPEQAAAAVDAGAHVYVAKPVAVDVPGCHSIAKSGRKATAKKRAFLVDFQTRTHPSFVTAVSKVRGGGLGDLLFGEAQYHAESPWEQYYAPLAADPGNPELRLKAWGLDRALSGDMITEQDIHALDVMSWIMGPPPLWATGCGGLKARPKVGTCWDHFVVHYQYPATSASSSAGASSRATARPRASGTACSAPRASWRPNTAERSSSAATPTTTAAGRRRSTSPERSPTSPSSTGPSSKGTSGTRRSSPASRAT